MRAVTDRRPLLDTALDVLLYAPVGAGVALGQWLPKLSAKGRDRLADQVQLAGVVGRLAVSEGRRRALRMGESLLDTATSVTAVSVTREPNPEELPLATDGDTASAGRQKADTATAVGTDAAADTGQSAAAGQETADRAAPARSRPARPRPRPPASLAIPEYDSLSASQVVARLEGLSPDELEEVRLHETTTRARRRVLARVDQIRRSA